MPDTMKEIRGGVENLRPIVSLQIEGCLTPLDFLVDTGFTGELTLPQRFTKKLGLEDMGPEISTTASGEEVNTRIYRGFINWFERRTAVGVLATPGNQALVGTQLLASCKLKIDFPEEKVKITKLV